MQPKTVLKAAVTFGLFFSIFSGEAQDSSAVKQRKNIIRYNISSPLVFGFDKNLVLGYERVVGRNQSFSINGGRSALPKLVSFSTDSFQLNSDLKNSGYNFSVDYRFYLGKENKYAAPHGIYIGPYYSYNHFDRDNEWTFYHFSGEDQIVTTTTKFDIHTFGFELGYQFIFWKRVTLDLIMVGPGVASYKLNTKTDNNLSEQNKQQLQDAVEQLLTQKFPGMNYVFSDQEFDASGTIGVWSLGYRYLVNIGFNF
jgi:hypothetical protein